MSSAALRTLSACATALALALVPSALAARPPRDPLGALLGPPATQTANGHRTPYIVRESGGYLWLCEHWLPAGPVPTIVECCTLAGHVRPVSRTQPPAA